MLEDSTGSTLLLFLVFVLVLVGAYFSTKFLSQKGGGMLRGKYLQVKERLMIGRDKQVMLIQAGSRYFVVGVTPQSIQMLGTLEEGGLIPIEQEVQEKQPFPSFGEWLSKARRAGEKDELHE